MSDQRMPDKGEGWTRPARLGGDEREQLHVKQAALEFLDRVGLVPTPDAIGQLTEAFLPCLAIICQRGWDPNGGTWRSSGVLGILGDVRKKFERLWERGWKHGKRHDDSGYDLMNYVGFYMRSGIDRWGTWGEPAQPEPEVQFPEEAERYGP
jgi:hypothetical protein